MSISSRGARYLFPGWLIVLAMVIGAAVNTTADGMV
jgi:hypothetical protein